MNTDTVRLNITIPKDLAASLDHYAGPGKKSRFIARAIRNQIEHQQRQTLEEALEEGYRATAGEGLAVSDEFEVADREWQFAQKFKN
jgi:metal-responsive CopG/Arc/MetJ family transcriptional regulator